MAIQKIPKIIAKVVLKRYILRYAQQPRHVQQAYMTALRRWAWLQPVWEEVYKELFPPETADTSQAEAIAAGQLGALPTAAGVQAFDSPYPRYRCTQGDPLRCGQVQPTVEAAPAKYCQEPCGFPLLLVEKTKLQGQRGTYQVEQWLGRRGTGRIYAGVQTELNQPVLIKEYLLPQLYFNKEQTWQYKQLFKNLAGIRLADGRSQDFRLLAPLEAIVDEQEERCYLVLDDRGLSPTLNQYLATGSMSETQVRRVLLQVLQTLEFLYGQKFCLSAGQQRTHLLHGNLSLDTLLIGQAENSLVMPQSAQEAGLQPTTDANFFIYLCDLALWEQLFNPPLLKTTDASVKQDLADLGYIAFYLLAGGVFAETGEPLSPLNDRDWRMSDRDLKQFILRLIGFEAPFETIEAARRALLQLPLTKPSIAPELAEMTEPVPVRKIPRWLVWLLGTLSLGVLAWFIWNLIAKPQLSTANRNLPQVNALQDVSGMPPGNFTYATVPDGIWSYVWQTPDLIQRGQTLEQRVKAAQPKLQLQVQPAVSTEAAISQVKAGTVDFAIVPLVQTLPDDLTADPIAYDGLAVFVAFSYNKRELGLPTQLQGQLSVEQVRRLFVGQVASWKEISKSPLPVNLYVPLNKEAIEIFQHRVFQNASKEQSQAVGASFVTPLPEFNMMRTVLRDFESRQIGSVGFSSFSKIAGQCSIYPLALQPKTSQAVQVLGFDANRSITPTTDLCNEKGNYRLRSSLLRSGQYPLAYPLVVVYSKDNDRSAIGQKFAELLKTREGQQLLSQTGLVPLTDP